LNHLNKTYSFESFIKLYTCQVINWFTPLNPNDYQKDILLADIAARNGGFDNVAAPLPHDFAIYLPGVMEALHLI
jgi:hypothetical protein